VVAEALIREALEEHQDKPWKTRSILEEREERMAGRRVLDVGGGGGGGKNFPKTTRNNALCPVAGEQEAGGGADDAGGAGARGAGEEEVRKAGVEGHSMIPWLKGRAAGR
jgi:hypothetical protein